MTFYCKRVQTPASISSITYYPFLLVKLINSKNSSKFIEIEGLIDSGADCSIINSAYASKLLNEDYKKGILVKTRGISPNPIDVYYHDVNLEIVGMADSKCKLTLGFMEGLKIGFLIGRKDFFSTYRIIFDMVNFSFDIENYNSIYATKS